MLLLTEQVRHYLSFCLHTSNRIGFLSLSPSRVERQIRYETMIRLVFLCIERVERCSGGVEQARPARTARFFSAARAWSMRLTVFQLHTHTLGSMSVSHCRFMHACPANTSVRCTLGNEHVIKEKKLFLLSLSPCNSASVIQH